MIKAPNALDAVFFTFNSVAVDEPRPFRVASEFLKF